MNVYSEYFNAGVDLDYDWYPSELQLDLGGLGRYCLQAGPYVAKPASLSGVCVAAEILAPSSVHIPIKDFSIPTIADMNRGITSALCLVLGGADVYVGCRGGLGRTGTVLALLTRASWEFTGVRMSMSPVEYVRSMYNSHAVETLEQEVFCAEANLSQVVGWLHKTAGVMGVKSRRSFFGRFLGHFRH